MKLYKASFEKSFPLRLVKINKKYIKRDPWMTLGLLTSSRHKCKLFSNNLKHPTEHNINMFKMYNNLYNKLKRHMKLQYYTSVLSNNKTDTKNVVHIKGSCWEKKTKNKCTTSFSINGINVTDKSQIVNSFNEYFSQIGEHTSQNVPTSKYNFKHYMPNPVPNSIFIEPIITATTVETTRKLKTKSCSGHDEISAILLEDSINYVAVPITHIIHRSLATGLVPGK